MTLEELKSILKSRTFKSTFKDSETHYQFSFSEIYISRDQKPLGVYELTKSGDNFKLIIVQKLQDVFTDNFKNVILNVPGDKRFPVIINFDSLAIHLGVGLDITLEAI